MEDIKLLNKKFMLMAIFLVSLLAISAVSASDLNSTDEIASEVAVDDNLEVISDEVLSTTHAVNGNTFSDIQKTINYANAGDTIVLSGNYAGNGSKIKIPKTLNVEGNGAILDAKGMSKIFEINGKNVKINNMTFINGRDISSGAIDWWSGTYDGSKDSYGIVTNCKFINCKVDYGAGAIYLFDNYLTVSNCYFESNSAGHGGAIVVVGKNCLIEYCEFKNNVNLDYQQDDIQNDTEVTIRNCIYSYDLKKFHDIIDLIDDASEGSTIELSGYYITDGNPIYIDKSINIIGIGKTTLDGLSKNPFFYVSADNVNISNLNFINGRNKENKFKSKEKFFTEVIYIGGNNCSVQDSNFMFNKGILSTIGVYGDNTAIKNCNFSNNGVSIEHKNLQSPGSLTVYDNWGEKDFEVLYNNYDSGIYAINYYYHDYNLDMTFSAGTKDYNDSVGAVKWFGDDGVLDNCIFSDNSGYYADYKLYGNNIKVIIPYLFSASDVSLYNGESQKYTVILTMNNSPVSNVYVNITVNGKTSKIKTDSKGKASIDLDLPIGSYNITSAYGGVLKTSKITVKPTISANDVNSEYLKTKISSAFLNTDGNALSANQVIFKINGREYSAKTNSNGVATANIDLDVGNYNVTAVNPVNNEQKTFKLVISKAKSNISLVSSQINGVTTLTASLTPSAATGNVIFNVNDKEQSVAVKSGKAILTLDNLDAGNYTVTAFYNGDSNLNASTSNTVTFNVADEYPILTAKAVTKTYGTSTKLVVYLKDNKGNAIANEYVEVVIGSAVKNIKTNANGQVTLAIRYAPGSYDAKISYETAQTTAKITVKKATPKITAKAKTFKKSVKTKKYAITLNVNQKVKVAIKVNKKTYYAYTNTKGQATFKITKLTKKGKYTATVSSVANKCYNKAKSVKVKITVK